MLVFEDLSALTPVIQLAVAPVFLLTSVAGFLGVLTNRLGRIVDRYRFLQEDVAVLDNAQEQELSVLRLRARLTNFAITACGLSALFVCLLIALLFVGSFFWAHSTTAVSLLFTSAMMTLTVGLFLFLAEISLTIKTFHM